MPRFTRVAPAHEGLVAWFWIPQWDLRAGVVSRQEVLAYPAANLVVEPTRVSLVGATTRRSERVLRDKGWAVGALLRPAALLRLTDDAAGLVDDEVDIDAPDLVEETRAALEEAPASAAGVVEAWLERIAGERTGEDQLVNDMADLLMTASDIALVEEAAARLSVSVRTLQRLAHRAVGLPPAAMIRRRRLQEAAQRMRSEPQTSLATIAADLGYSDQAHLANDFRSVLGFTPSRYRADVVMPPR